MTPPSQPAVVSEPAPCAASGDLRQAASAVLLAGLLLFGVVTGCAAPSPDSAAPTSRVEQSVRDGRSSSDQLYGTYGRIARERAGSP